jgi:hypothetical protein
MSERTKKQNEYYNNNNNVIPAISEADGRLIQLKSEILTLVVEPVEAIHSNGSRQYMERIIGTTKYLSNFKKMIYDVAFLKLYNHDLKIPEGCMAIDNFLYKIEKWAHLDHADSFADILHAEAPKTKGTCFYLDGKLVQSNVPLLKNDDLRDYYLGLRNTGEMWFDKLVIIDPSGNHTEYLPSKKALKLKWDKELLEIMEAKLKRKKHVDFYKKEVAPKKGNIQHSTGRAIHGKV